MDCVPPMHAATRSLAGKQRSGKDDLDVSLEARLRPVLRGIEHFLREHHQFDHIEAGEIVAFRRRTDISEVTVCPMRM